MAEAETTRVIVADRQPVVRAGIASAIQAAPGLRCVGEAHSVESLITALTQTPCDVVTLDMTFDGLDGVDAIRTIKARHPTVGVLVFAGRDEMLFAERCIRLGARGYLMKDVPVAKVLDAIAAIARGKVAVSPAVAQRMIGQSGTAGTTRRPTHGIESLSDRELEVLSLLGMGLSTREIAKRLHLSVKTIDTYRDNLKHKLGLENATRLIRYAVRYAMDNEIG
ncbi:MAG: response regulator transcription factor [Planctomycetota bacterium]